jgi:hypothetical protein
VPRAHEYRWTKEKKGLPPLTDRFEPFADLVLDPNTGVVHACTYRGLYRRSDKGWEQVFPIGFVSTAAFERGQEKRALAATLDGAYARQAGSKWARLTGVPPWDPSASVKAVCFGRGRMYVSTNDGLYVEHEGVWKRIMLPRSLPAMEHPKGGAGCGARDPKKSSLRDAATVAAGPGVGLHAQSNRPRPPVRWAPRRMRTPREGEPILLALLCAFAPWRLCVECLLIGGKDK